MCVYCYCFVLFPACKSWSMHMADPLIFLRVIMIAVLLPLQPIHIDNIPHSCTVNCCDSFFNCYVFRFYFIKSLYIYYFMLLSRCCGPGHNNFTFMVTLCMCQRKLLWLDRWTQHFLFNAETITWNAFLISIKSWYSESIKTDLELMKLMIHRHVTNSSNDGGVS